MLKERRGRGEVGRMRRMGMGDEGEEYRGDEERSSGRGGTGEGRIRWRGGGWGEGFEGEEVEGAIWRRR